MFAGVGAAPPLYAPDFAAAYPSYDSGCTTPQQNTTIDGLD
jgi:hypothetical protein